MNPALRSDLLAWYRIHARDLPWRNTNDPYRIWLSEIILQQTRVDQGRPYYERFTERFPTLKDLAEAKDEEVMKLWEGLGYYSRARNLLKAARLVQEAYDGRFPDTAEGLEKLPGIGPYTAAAIASFAFGQAIGVVDGNVFRLLSRLFDIDACIDDGKNRPIFQALADELIDKEVPGTTNQALMEIGATICTPRPNCQKCPLQTHCLAREKGTADLRPVRKKRTRSKKKRSTTSSCSMDRVRWPFSSERHKESGPDSSSPCTQQNIKFNQKWKSGASSIGSPTGSCTFAFSCVG